MLAGWPAGLPAVGSGGWNKQMQANVALLDVGTAPKVGFQAHFASLGVQDDDEPSARKRKRGAKEYGDSGESAPQHACVCHLSWLFLVWAAGGAQ